MTTAISAESVQTKVLDKPRRKWRRVKTRPRAITALCRQADAVALRSARLSYREIASRLGVQPNAAFFAVKQGLSREVATLPIADRVQERTLELSRLDAMTAAAWAVLWAAGSKPAIALRALDTLLRIMERRSRLLHLDAPRPKRSRSATQTATNRNVSTRQEPVAVGARSNI